jgi:hypothetical protein
MVRDRRSVALERPHGTESKRHFKPIDGRMRFYANGHGYFVVGEKVRYPGVYEGVEIGAVADAHYASKHDKRVLYRILFRLPTQSHGLT